jgi:hypothetical protein
MHITKNQDLDLDMFLHSIICLPIKNITKYFTTNLGNTKTLKNTYITQIQVQNFNITLYT